MSGNESNNKWFGAIAVAMLAGGALSALGGASAPASGSSLDERVAALEQTVVRQQNELSELRSSPQGHQEDLSQLRRTVSGLSDRLVGIDGRLDRLREDLRAAVATVQRIPDVPSIPQLDQRYAPKPTVPERDPNWEPHMMGK